MTLDVLIARAAAKAPAQIVRPPAFTRETSTAGARDAHAEILARTAEKIRTTYMDGWETGFAAGKTIARAAFVNGILSGATLAFVAALLALACAAKV